MPEWPQSLARRTSDLPRLLASVPEADAIPSGWLAQWEEIWCPLASHIATLIKPEITKPPVVGIHGGQGSGADDSCR